MNPEIKTRWTGKLREEGRTQTTEALRDDDGQCCLDVLCEVAVEDEVIAPPKRNEVGIYEYEDRNGEIENATLPLIVRDWAGLDTSDPDIADPDTGKSRPASNWNDYIGKDFLEIADMIDADETL